MPALRAVSVRWAPIPVAGLALACWWLWPTADDPEPPATTPDGPETAVVDTPPRVAAAMPPAAVDSVEKAGDGPAPEPGDDPLWNAVERDCPWPPEPSSWRVLDDRCRSAMTRTDANEDWRRVFDDPLGTRRAVVEALGRPECRVPTTTVADDGTLRWPGETRPDLRESCAAEAMVRLADLQYECVETLHTDWDELITGLPDYGALLADSQEEYYSRARDKHRTDALNLWHVYICRFVPPEVFDWVDELPDPPAIPEQIRGPVHVRALFEVTQRTDLYQAARRLGWDFPDATMNWLKYEAEKKTPAHESETAKIRAEMDARGVQYYRDPASD